MSGKSLFLILGCTVVISACGNYNSAVSNTLENNKTEESNTVLKNTQIIKNEEKTREIMSDVTILSKKPDYRYCLSEDDLQIAKQIIIEYYNREPYCGAVFIFPASDESDVYNDEIIGKYSVGNVIIFLVLTEKDIKEGNPERHIYLGRLSKDETWEVVSEGF